MGCYKDNKRWRKKNPKIWQAGKMKYYRQFAFEYNNENWRERWDNIEDLILLNSKITDRKLHMILGRSVGAIQHRRHRLNKLDKLCSNK